MIPGTADANPVIEAMATCPAVRRFRDQPVSDGLLESVVWAATRAPSPRNEQPWEFVVVRDDLLRQQIAELVRHRASALSSHLPELRDPKERRMWGAVARMIEDLTQVPVLVFACGRVRRGAWAASEDGQRSAVYGATQNLLVAARSLGLGTAMTVVHRHGGHALRELLNLPNDLEILATVVLGWPEQPLKTVRRKPVSDVLHWDRHRG